MRLGRFSFTDAVEDWPETKELLGEMNILRREPSFSIAGVTEVLAYHPEFDEVKEGEVIPTYLFTYEKQADGSVIRRQAERQ